MFFYLHETLDFLYGLPFVIAASIIWLHPGRRSWIALERSLGTFGWFAILHGTGTWLQMWMIFHSALAPDAAGFLKDVAVLMILASNVTLFLFARRLTLLTLADDNTRVRLVFHSYLIVALAVAAGLAIFTGDVFHLWDCVARPLFLFPASLLLAFSLRRYYERERLMIDTLHAKRFLRLAGLSFFFFAFLGGLLPDRMLEDCTACTVHGIPAFVFVHLARIVLSILIIAGLLGMVRVAGVELERRVQETVDRLRHQEERLRTLSETDPLTGAANRLRLMDALRDAILECEDRDHPLSLILFDIDRFKRINDVHGHVEGDRILCELTRACHAMLPNRALLARMGGEEFCILLPAMPLQHALVLARDLRGHVASRDFGLKKPVTCSFGVARFRQRESVTSFFTRADNALYRAKRNGRNRVEFHRQ